MTDEPPKTELAFNQDNWEKVRITPWQTYKVRLPPRPLPPLAVRPHIRTKRLVIRPLLPSDLDAFYNLRRIPETQTHSTFRGRAIRDLDEARESLAQLQAPHDEHHWYFGAFLASTGELIGEGGLADTDYQPVSGWTRCEVLINSAFWRQGYGTEFFSALLDSWWDLPRERRKHQLLPFCIGDPQEPGGEVVERLELIWEADNVAACKFFPKSLNQVPLSDKGFFTGQDWRKGREGDLVRWAGTMVTNPRITIDPEAEVSSDNDASGEEEEAEEEEED